MCRRYLRRLLECYAISECLKLFHGPADRSVAISTGKVLGAEFVIGRAIAHDVERNFEHLMRDRNDRFFVTAMRLDATISRLQRGPLRARRRERAFDQRTAQIAI